MRFKHISTNSPVTRIKCWQFLQTTYTPYWHFNKMRFITFTLQVYDLNWVRGDCGDVTGNKAGSPLTAIQDISTFISLKPLDIVNVTLVYFFTIFVVSKTGVLTQNIIFSWPQPIKPDHMHSIFTKCIWKQNLKKHKVSEILVILQKCFIYSGDWVASQWARIKALMLEGKIMFGLLLLFL